jgi:calcineurin-like phosphoesterase family protein
MIYYISDLHLGDEIILKLCSRPFASTSELFEVLVQRWNAKVADTDDVYILGDIANGSSALVKEFFSRVKGRKHLIVGNHDEEYMDDYSKTKSFVSISGLEYVVDNGRKVLLCHYPIMDWFSGDETIYLVYGHIHNKFSANTSQMYRFMQAYYNYLPAYNASVDVTNFEPVTLDELIKMKEVI